MHVHTLYKTNKQAYKGTIDQMRAELAKVKK